MAASIPEACWTVVGFDDSTEQPSVRDLQSSLEKGNDSVKIDTMRKILGIMMNGDPLPQLMMTIIRFILPSRNKSLKKMLLFYWELCPKYDANGKMKQEMILVCNFLLNDLKSANEYVCGMTLKFLCKIKEQELLEPLVPACRSALEHRHAYVRKNAILAIYSIFQHQEHLVPDASELIHNYLQQEVDNACRRNALLMLTQCDTQRAISYLQTIFPQIPTFDENLQLALIELIKKDCRSSNAPKGKYITAIVSLLESSSASVKFEAAQALLGLTSSVMAIKEVAKCYVDLCIKESDNNIKLIVLDRLKNLKKEHSKILSDLSMDLLRVLSSTDIEVCRKVINLVLDVLSSRSVFEIVGFFKKELAKTLDIQNEKSLDYRHLLIHAIHQCAVKFPDVAAEVVHTLMEFLSDSNKSSAVDVITFIREVMERNEILRKKILESMLLNFHEIRTGRVMRGALWIIGEYALDLDSIQNSFKNVRTSLGELPILSSEQKQLQEKADKLEAGVSNENLPTTAPVKKVLADGTYASETAYTIISPSKFTASHSKPPLRSLVLNGDYFLAAVLATTLTKLVLRLRDLEASVATYNACRAEALLIMTSILRVGQSSISAVTIEEDSVDRILLCIRALANETDSKMREIFTKLTRQVYTNMVQHGDKANAAKNAENKKAERVAIEKTVKFALLKHKSEDMYNDDELEEDLKLARGANDFKAVLKNKLEKIVQLTGFTDPVYAEAIVEVHQYDILLDILIVNLTSETLQNLTVEFATLGDLKLMERPAPKNMGPRSFHNIKANIKVSSTDNGAILGNIVYDGRGVGDNRVVNLHDIPIDIMDYIRPATCNESQFRTMWLDFEWENKIIVNTNITDLREYLNRLLKCTNMYCLTPEQALSGDCGFLAANLHARSIFGEDALANVTLEKLEGGTLSGHIRIRSKTQGIALSLGDKISTTQKIKV